MTRYDTDVFGSCFYRIRIDSVALDDSELVALDLGHLTCPVAQIDDVQKVCFIGLDRYLRIDAVVGQNGAWLRLIATRIFIAFGLVLVYQVRRLSVVSFGQWNHKLPAILVGVRCL